MLRSPRQPFLVGGALAGATKSVQPYSSEALQTLTVLLPIFSSLLVSFCGFVFPYYFISSVLCFFSPLLLSIEDKLVVWDSRGAKKCNNRIHKGDPKYRNIKTPTQTTN